MSWSMTYQKMKHPGRFNLAADSLKEVSVHDVRLDSNSIHWRAQQTNLEYLMMLDEEALLSATAQMWASTHNDTLKEKMWAVVSALSLVRRKWGPDLSAFQSELFDRFEAIKPVWAPYYTIHKVDSMSVPCGFEECLWGRSTAFVAGSPFRQPCFLVLLAVQADDISGFHANTQIPVVIGAQMRYEAIGDPLYKTIATSFMDIVSLLIAMQPDERQSDPTRLANTLQTENEESCTTYNMLKVCPSLRNPSRGFNFRPNNSDQSIQMEKFPEAGTDADVHATFRLISDDTSDKFSAIVNYSSSRGMKLSCNSESSEAGFSQASRFVMKIGISEYHPISFLAKGKKEEFPCGAIAELQR
ncbi:AGC (cAMP-dependent, cGMP-dependent and protein kinase C) kinase family protein, putative isoform 1 [Hibiscus syriacus]|uniref:AGC (cAMP-dependent, cGMP-dependent and protein kinase C) kinase family protein, putative isoform 1 n=1 Tax=Hibiscus syriacus TaxID=106335 RepID=A0A6A2Y313_HIBSY|nr:AGC (cAMP-dependent, cGMP-dependent and protein kinase C) kinase family protein, putative isoform 1 [Hibiscus syriacus]